jgi:hypothetical protein
MKKSLGMLAAAAGLALGAAQGAQAAVSEGFFMTANQPTQTRQLNQPSGWFVRYTHSLSSTSWVGGRVQPTQSNQMFGVPTPFSAAILVACVQPRSMQASLAERSWTFNANNSYTALTKSCLGYGNATAMQGTMSINI